MPDAVRRSCRTIDTHGDVPYAVRGHADRWVNKVVVVRGAGSPSIDQRSPGAAGAALPITYPVHEARVGP